MPKKLLMPPAFAFATAPPKSEMTNRNNSTAVKPRQRLLFKCVHIVLRSKNTDQRIDGIESACNFVIGSQDDLLADQRFVHRRSLLRREILL